LVPGISQQQRGGRLSIPCAAALQIIIRELWQATAPGGPPGGGKN